MGDILPVSGKTYQRLLQSAICLITPYAYTLLSEQGTLALQYSTLTVRQILATTLLRFGYAHLTLMQHQRMLHTNLTITGQGVRAGATQDQHKNNQQAETGKGAAEDTER